ncbi:bifunctional 3-(3-hydroxy-phenyl)propionate/3-hydroxycinnamic acid hydroxylase [Streptomyces sp. NBC_01261]|uniref:bifunctional 3-(3-hydroxy-phenyl)propionate/3-hydroxycinnamic acid hydroxylase n=1 Tax=unclassified Streptomyces TaxID=2593676 RepID=UPI002E356CF7|nr:bifunctional 3-(3-hydroxy-phenyl)propionate/3-hydroxycinnamic acid hydroxylase [Streptomyces sp. NBC_01261]
MSEPLTPHEDPRHRPPSAGPMKADVLVVGAGPTGLTAAHLLGSLGVRVLLVERNPTTSDDAKAISLDDESLRTLQSAGVSDAVYPIIVPGTGTKYFGADGRGLVHARGPGDQRFGHPFKNSFAQPDLERVLLEELRRRSGVDTRFATELFSLEQHDDHVRVGVGPSQEKGPTEYLDVSYVLGCDGGRSTVRELLSIPMQGESFPDMWLVADTLGDPHDQRYGMHRGEPRRPTVIVPGGAGRCRYEFLLHPGEGKPGDPPPFELVRELLRPYREITPDQVERSVTYTFHALLADRLRDGRCFLLGDAAHMMPPFAGQGLNSGVRDAANLCWKIADVLGGRASDALLDTYDSERRPHAQAVINLSVRLGLIVMTTSRLRAHLRDLLVRIAMHTPWGRRYLTEMRYRPNIRIRSGAVAPLDGQAQSPIGRALPQPRVLHGPHHRVTWLDDVLGRGWSLLGVGLTDADWAAAARAGLPAGTRVDVVLNDRAPRDHPGRTGIADADGRLDAAFGGLDGRFVLVRPDRLIAAVFEPDQSDRVSHSLGRFAPRPSADPCVPPTEHSTWIGHKNAGQQTAQPDRPVAGPGTKSVPQTQGGPR